MDSDRPTTETTNKPISIDSLLRRLQHEKYHISHGVLLLILGLATFQPKALRKYNNINHAFQLLKQKVFNKDRKKRIYSAAALTSLDDCIGKIVKEGLGSEEDTASDTASELSISRAESGRNKLRRSKRSSITMSGKLTKKEDKNGSAMEVVKTRKGDVDGSEKANREREPDEESIGEDEQEEETTVIEISECGKKRTRTRKRKRIRKRKRQNSTSTNDEMSLARDRAAYPIGIIEANGKRWIIQFAEMMDEEDDEGIDDSKNELPKKDQGKINVSDPRTSSNLNFLQVHSSGVGEEDKKMNGSTKDEMEKDARDLSEKAETKTCSDKKNKKESQEPDVPREESDPSFMIENELRIEYNETLENKFGTGVGCTEKDGRWWKVYYVYVDLENGEKVEENGSNIMKAMNANTNNSKEKFVDGFIESLLNDAIPIGGNENVEGREKENGKHTPEESLKFLAKKLDEIIDGCGNNVDGGVESEENDDQENQSANVDVEETVQTHNEVCLNSENDECNHSLSLRNSKRGGFFSFYQRLDKALSDREDSIRSDTGDGPGKNSKDKDKTTCEKKSGIAETKDADEGEDCDSCRNAQDEWETLMAFWEDRCEGDKVISSCIENEGNAIEEKMRAENEMMKTEENEVFEDSLMQDNNADLDRRNELDRTDTGDNSSRKDPNMEIEQGTNDKQNLLEKNFDKNVELNKTDDLENGDKQKERPYCLEKEEPVNIETISDTQGGWTNHSTSAPRDEIDFEEKHKKDEIQPSGDQEQNAGRNDKAEKDEQSNREGERDERLENQTSNECTVCTPTTATEENLPCKDERAAEESITGVEKVTLEIGEADEDDHGTGDEDDSSATRNNWDTIIGIPGENQEEIVSNVVVSQSGDDDSKDRDVRDKVEDKNYKKGDIRCYFKQDSRVDRNPDNTETKGAEAMTVLTSADILHPDDTVHESDHTMNETGNEKTNREEKFNDVSKINGEEKVARDKSELDTIKAQIPPLENSIENDNNPSEKIVDNESCPSGENLGRKMVEAILTENEKQDESGIELENKTNCQTEVSCRDENVVTNSEVENDDPDINNSSELPVVETSETKDEAGLGELGKMMVNAILTGVEAAPIEDKVCTIADDLKTTGVLETTEPSEMSSDKKNGKPEEDQTEPTEQKNPLYISIRPQKLKGNTSREESIESVEGISKDENTDMKSTPGSVISSSTLTTATILFPSDNTCTENDDATCRNDDKNQDQPTPSADTKSAKTIYETHDWPVKNDKIINELGERYCIMKDIVRYEQLTKYFRNSLNEDPPYAPRRYRVAVRGKLTERELELRRAQTINKVNFEIQVMEDRIIDRREKLTAIDERIEALLKLDEDRRVETAEAVGRDEREIFDNFEKHYFAKKREYDRKLKESTTEHLLTFVDDSSPKRRGKKKDMKSRERVQ